MAYYKIKSNGDSTTYAERDGMYAFYYATVLNSIYTGTPVNSALSAAVGTAPSANMYSQYSTAWPDASSSTDGYWGFVKKYYVQDTNFEPRMAVYAVHDGTYGLRFKHGTHNLSNLGPGGGTSAHWTGQTNTTNNYGKLGSTRWSWIDEVHMIVNDTTWAIQVIGTGTDATRQVATMVINDIEYNASVDTHSYAGNTYYCPTVSFNSYIQGNPYVDTAAPYADQHRWTAYRPQYVDRNGTYRNTYQSDTGLQWGYVTSSAGAYPHLYPEARARVGSMQVANGETTNLLIPIYWDGGFRNEDTDPRYGRLMNVYRTTEGSSLRTGDVITDGTTRYRIFANCWKGGGSNLADSGWSQTLAFPEDNVPYVAP